MERLLLVHDGAEGYSERIRQRFPDVELSSCLHERELDGALIEFNPTIVFTCATDGFPRQAHRAVLAAPSVRWVHVGGSGFEHLADWADFPLRLSNGRGVLASFLADTVIGAMIALNAGFLRFIDQQRRRLWQKRPFPALAGREVLVIGPGAIGQRVAQRAKALGMRTRGLSRSAEPVDGFDEVWPMARLIEAVKQADVISPHVRLTEDTTKLIDGSVFAAMKPDALFINTSRGGVVDQNALIEALKHERIRGAYLDVFAQEPLPESSPLWTLENLLLTPHCADQVENWEELHALFFMDNLENWLNGEPLANEQQRN